MAKTVVAVFSRSNDVETAVNNLKDLNYDPHEMSLVMKDVREAKELKSELGVSVAEGATTGAMTGGALGGLTGLLVGLGILTLPGIGPLLIAGPFATALGLTGAAATTASGAATGAIAGGIVGALASLGIPKDTATRYEEQIKAGGIILAVPVHDQRVEEVRKIVERNGARDATVLDLTEQRS
jgi:uncharacterized membrane protein